jgi:hypothetical protein
MTIPAGTGKKSFPGTSYIGIQSYTPSRNNLVPDALYEEITSENKFEKYIIDPHYMERRPGRSIHLRKYRRWGHLSGGCLA